MPPAIALVGAAASVAGGMAAVGGTMAGFAAASLGTQLVAGAMLAGGVMTGLGAITGNKKLQKWGGVLSIAGGIGGLATGAFSSAASSIAEQSAREGFRAAELGAQAAEAGGALGGIAEAAGGLAQANAAALGTTDIGIGAASAGGAPAVAPVVSAPTAAVPSSVNLTNAGGTMQPLVRGGAAAANEGGMLSSATSWMEKNPKLTQAGAGMLQAGLGAYGQQEALKEQMRMQEEQQLRARQRMSDSVKGLVAPVYQRKGG